MEFAVIDNNEDPMDREKGRGKGFSEALADWAIGKHYDFVRYNDIADRRSELLTCKGLILSGSKFDLAGRSDELDREIYRRMTPEFDLVLDYAGPVLGVCFGHQFLALAEEFDENRTAFGKLRLRNMQRPENDYFVRSVRMNACLHFMDQKELWVQFNHKLEVNPNAAFQEHFEVIARSDECPVDIMQHRSREWFGVQFHPEVGVQSQLGKVDRHEDAVRDGQALIRDFIRYSMNRL
jgi:GMP synthase (glutamine-hydrolysing)